MKCFSAERRHILPFVGWPVLTATVSTVSAFHHCLLFSIKTCVVNETKGSNKMEFQKYNSFLLLVGRFVPLRGRIFS